MRYSTAFAAASILSVVSAGHHDHALFHKRHNDIKNASDQCSTIWSTWYGEPTLVPLSVPPKPTTTSKEVVSTSNSPPPPPPSTSAKAAPVQALQAASAPVGGGGGNDFFGHPTGHSQMLAITFSPYYGDSQASSGCSDTGEMQAQIQKIAAAGFKRIRLYATDCQSLTVAAPAAIAAGMRLILGIFPNNPGSADSDFANQLQDIQSFISAHGSGSVDIILVGNEPMFGQHATVDQIASYLQQTKAAFPNIKISSALTHPEILQYGSQLCPLIDVVAAQIHPFFSTSYLAPSLSGTYVEAQMDLMSAACGGKAVFVSECGYPNGGGSYESQIAGTSEQAAAIRSIQRSGRSGDITMFSSSDDGWKLAPNVQAYEAKFNCLGLF